MRPFSLLVLLLAACATASASRSSSLFETPWQPPEGQRCEQYDPPTGLPTVNEVVDSTSLLRALGESGANTAGSTLFALQWDSTGAAKAPRLLESTLPSGGEETVARVLEDHLRARQPDDRASVLFKIKSSSNPHFEVGPQEECAPVLRNRQEIVRMLDAGMDHIRQRHPSLKNPARPTLVQVFIDTTGAVTKVELAELTQFRSFDSLAINVAQHLRFTPARHNREPVPVWIRMPMNFEVAEQISPVDTLFGQRRPRFRNDP